MRRGAEQGRSLFPARNMRRLHNLLRGIHIFVRSAPEILFREVRSGDSFAHSAASLAGRGAPFSEKVAGRRDRNRRKSSKRSLPRAH
ncbi:MAG: hypothetical protein C0483_00375 [Pirellula sp.]|nr:hypothetical protein [Pirellula sp.]